MNVATRIPPLPNKSLHGMKSWFSKMCREGLLYHVDDRAENIVEITTGNPFFTPEECAQLNTSVDILFEAHGDLVYDVGIVYFHRAMGYKPQPLSPSNC